MALSAVEDDVMDLGGLHQTQEVLIMFLWGMKEYAYIIMNGNNAR